MPGQDLIDAIEAARRRPGAAQLEEVFRIALHYSADDRACRDVLDRLTRTHRAAVAEAWAQHHLERTRGRAHSADTRWHAGPTHEGWYVVHRREAESSDLALLRFEDGECFSETGAACGTPDTTAFAAAKWIGPVEKP